MRREQEANRKILSSAFFIWFTFACLGGSQVLVGQTLTFQTGSSNLTSQTNDQLVIVVFGCSSTAPRGSLKIFAKHLEERLGTPERPVRVINAGVPGNTTRDACERLNRDVIAYHPSFVTI